MNRIVVAQGAVETTWCGSGGSWIRRGMGESPAKMALGASRGIRDIRRAMLESIGVAAYPICRVRRITGRVCHFVTGNTVRG